MSTDYAAVAAAVTSSSSNAVIPPASPPYVDENELEQSRVRQKSIVVDSASTSQPTNSSNYSTSVPFAASSSSASSSSNRLAALNHPLPPPSSTTTAATAPYDQQPLQHQHQQELLPPKSSNGNLSALNNRRMSPNHHQYHHPQGRPLSSAGLRNSTYSSTQQQQQQQSPVYHKRVNSGPIDLQAAASSSNNNNINNMPYAHGHSMSQASLGNNNGTTPVRSRMPRPMSSRSSMSSMDFSNYDFQYGHAHRQSTSSPSINEQSTQYAMASMFDLSQSSIAPHLGNNAAQSLVPRMKTIEMYRKNAKKSNDPVIQFQFAQYMLQTALLSGTGAQQQLQSSGASSSESSLSNHLTAGDMSRPTSTLSLPLATNNNDKRASTLSTMSNVGHMTPEEEKRLKKSLLKEAVANLRKLSDRGFADAQYLLGDAYASGALGKPDMRESFVLFHLAAKHGHGEASYRAALCLEEGWGTSKDVRRAVQFLRYAASKNQPGAMLRLGLACFNGRLGLSQNVSTKQEGIKWLTRSAEAASEVYPQAPYELAKIYEVGYRDIVFKDWAYAVQLYVKSSELGYIPASAKLGHAYEYGQLECPQDAALSIHYYTLAAIGGDPGSMLAMCAWYMVGAESILPRNEEEAFEWAKKAAEAGLAKAQFAVGYFMESGIGTERDILNSSHWYRQAAAGGDERAVERLKKNRTMAANGYRGKRGKNEDGKDCIIM